MVDQKAVTVGGFSGLPGKLEVETPSQASGRFESVARAPRRGKGGEFEVCLLPMDVDQDLAAISRLPYAERLRDRLEASSQIELLDAGDTEVAVELAAEADAEPRIAADVLVHTSAFITETYFVPGFDDDLLATPMLVLEAHIETTYGSNPVEFIERGPLGRNSEVLERFSARVRATLETEVGPELPTDPALRAPANRPQPETPRTWR